MLSSCLQVQQSIKSVRDQVLPIGWFSSGPLHLLAIPSDWATSLSLSFLQTRQILGQKICEQVGILIPPQESCLTMRWSLQALCALMLGISAKITFIDFLQPKPSHVSCTSQRCTCHNMPSHLPLISIHCPCPLSYPSHSLHSPRITIRFPLHNIFSFPPSACKF